MSFTDYQHQIRAYNRFKDEDFGALFCEQGTGKTRVAIKLAEHKFIKKRNTATLVITTVGLVGNWLYTELPLHATVPYRTWVWNKDTEWPDTKDHVWVLMNIEALISARFQPFFKEFLKKHPRFTLIVDESTKAKNIKASRTKQLILLARRAADRFIMSGTPTPNSPLDIFSQAEILSPGLLGFKSIYAFKARYAVVVIERNGPRVFEKITGFKNMVELSNKIASFAEIVKKKDCLDLPPKIYRTIDVPLTTEQRKHYTSLKQVAMTYIDGDTITASNTVSLINRLLQICSGQLKLEDRYFSIDTDRLGVLEDLIERSSSKTLVWVSYVQNALDISKKLGDSCVLLPSGLSLVERQKRIDEFKAGGARSLVANPASAGHGITLIESANSIYYSNNFNYENRAQSEDRNHRIGQTESVLYTDLIAKGTVEQRVVDILKYKEKMATELLTSREYLKELFS